MRRTEHGQGMLEYVGIAVVAAILVGAVVTAVTDAPVGETIESAVCKITSFAGGSGDCSSPDGSEAASGDEDGGAFDGATAEGSVETGGEDQSDDESEQPDPLLDRGPGCIPVGDQPDSDGVPGGSVTVATPDTQSPVRTQSSVTLGTSSPTVDNRGYEWQDVSVQVKHQASVNAQSAPGDLPKDLSVSASLYNGTTSEYKVTVPPSMVADVSAGDVPNPLAPRALAPGVGVTMSNEFYAGQKVEATYRKIKAGFSYEEGSKVSTAVQRLPNGDMRVLTGPSEVVRQAMSLGIGTDSLSAALVASREFEDYRLEKVDFDIDSPEGLNAYYRLMMQGEVPDAGTAGVVDRSTLEGFKGGAKNGVEVKVGSWSAGFELNSSDYDVATETHADGSETFTVASRINDQKRVITQEYDASGAPDGSSQTLILRNVDPTVVNTYNQIYAQLSPEQSEVSGPQNMVFTFDEADYQQWQQEAREIIAYQVSNLPYMIDSEFGGEAPTPDEIGEWVENHDVEDIQMLRGMGTGVPQRAIEILKASKYPDNIANSTFIAMTQSLHQNTLVHDLAMWQSHLSLARGVNPTEIEQGAGSVLCRGTA